MAKGLVAKHNNMWIMWETLLLEQILFDLHLRVSLFNIEMCLIYLFLMSEISKSASLQPWILGSWSLIMSRQYRKTTVTIIKHINMHYEDNFDFHLR